jgi:hypothetical protein
MRSRCSRGGSSSTSRLDYGGLSWQAQCNRFPFSQSEWMGDFWGEEREEEEADTEEEEQNNRIHREQQHLRSLHTSSTPPITTIKEL